MNTIKNVSNDRLSRIEKDARGVMKNEFDDWFAARDALHEVLIEKNRRTR